MTRPGVIPRGLDAAAVRAIGASRAKRAGDDFEAELDAMHERWRDRGFAYLQRGHPATVMSRKGLRYTGKNGVDFVGVYRTFAVAIEAKSRSGAASFELIDRKATKPGHKDQDTERRECEALQAASRAGALAFYLVRDPELSRVYLVGPEHFPTLLAGGRVPLRDDARRGAASRVPYLTLDPRRHALELARGGDLWPWPLLFPDLASMHVSHYTHPSPATP